MSNGIALTSSRFLCAFLAASVLALAGCNNRPVPPAHDPAGVALLDPAVSGHQRDDLSRGHVWGLNSRGAFIYYTASGKLEEIALPSWQWVDTPYACPPDLALGPDGAAVITSNVVPVLWRVDPRTLAVTKHELVLDADHDKDVGFSRLTYSAKRGAFFAVSETHGSAWRIDLALRTGRKIAVTESARKTCGGSV